MRKGKRGFFSFEKMITIPFIKLIYLLGFIGINLSLLLILLHPFLLIHKWFPKIELLERYKFNFVIWIVLFLLAHLLWRLFCEGFIVIFRIYEILSFIVSEVRGEKEEKKTKFPELEKPPKILRTREDYKRWKERRF